MKKLLIGLGILLVVLVGAALVAPSFVDWNQYRAEIAAEAEKATGRRLTIGGDVSLRVLPAPVLQATDVSLANIEGGSQPEMLTLDSLDIRVSLMPLLSGRLQVNSVVLVEPRILLEVLADGRSNWDFDPAAESAAAPEPAPEEGGEPAETASDRGAAEEPAPMPAPESASGSGGDFAIQVDSFVIENGVLVYRDAGSGLEERVENIEARIVAESLRGPFVVEGEASLRGERATIEATAGRLLDAGATTLNLALGLPDAKAQAQFTGSLSRHPTSMAVRGKLKGEGENLASALRAVVPEAGGLPSALGNPFTLEGNLEADQNEATIEALRVSLGDTAVEGSGNIVLGQPIDARLKLNTTHLDLDALLAGATEDRTPAVSAEEAAGQAADSGDDAARPGGRAPSPEAASASPAAFVIPADIEASVQLGIDALVYREQVVRQIRLNAALSEGRVEVNQAMALLPGGSDLSVTGAITAEAQGPRFAGHLEGASDNLRGVLEWLGVDVSAVPADRLRKTSLSTNIDAQPTQVSLSELDLRVDVSRLAGGVVAALRDRPGLGIGLALDSINLDGYLPQGGSGGVAAGTSDTDDAGDSATQVAGRGGGEPDQSDPAQPSGLGPLDAFDANLNLRIGSLVYGGQTARDISIEGTLQGGAFNFKQARVADLAGSALSYSGSISGLGSKPALDGSVDLKVADPVKLGRMAGVETDLLNRLGAFNMTGNLKGSLDGLGFNTRLALLGGNFNLAGTARPLAGPPAFDVTLEAEHPDLVRLADTLAGPTGLGAGLGGLDVRARIAGTPDQVSVSDIDGRVGPAALSGSLGLALGEAGPAPEAVDLTMHIQHGNLGQLSQAVGGPALGGDLGAIDLKGRVASEGQEVKLTGLSGIAGPLGISGEADLTLGDPAAGTGPGLGRFNLNLRLKHRSLASLAAAAGAGGAVNPAFGGVDLGGHVFGTATRVDMRDLQGSLGPVALNGTASVDLSGPKPFVAADLNTGELSLSQLLAAGGAGGAGGTGGGSLSPRWSAQPIELAALQTVNADIKLRSSALIYGDVRLNDADIAALLTDGLLDLQRLTGRVHGGNVQVSGRLDSNGVPSAAFALSAVEIESSTLLIDMAEFDRLSGPVTINANVTTRGRSEAELVSGLSGQGDIAGTLTAKARAEEAVGNALLSILGQEVKEVRGIAGTANSLFGAFAGAPSRLNGTFLVDAGVVRTTDLRLDGRDAVALTHGAVNLPAWAIDSRTEVYRGGGSAPFLTAELTGPLDEPNTRIGGAALQRQQQPANQPLPDGTPAPQPEAPTLPQTPEDLLKGLLKKLN